VYVGGSSASIRLTGALRVRQRRPGTARAATRSPAGYHKDACTAQGISDAFRDAELLSTALDAAFTGRLPHQAALVAYQHTG
jgi:hypothetical protein